MKDPNLAILNAYKSALTPLEVGSKTIPVFPAIAPLKNVPAKYVLLSTQNALQNRTKCGFWYDCTITVDVVTRYPNGNGDVTYAMKIGEEIQNIVQVDGLNVSDFYIIDTIQQPSTTLPLQTQTEDIYRYILTFRHRLNTA
jgi:hypothetical protein